MRPRALPLLFVSFLFFSSTAAGVVLLHSMQAARASCRRAHPAPIGNGKARQGWRSRARDASGDGDGRGGTDRRPTARHVHMTRLYGTAGRDLTVPRISFKFSFVETPKRLSGIRTPPAPNPCVVPPPATVHRARTVQGVRFGPSPDRTRSRSAGAVGSGSGGGPRLPLPGPLQGAQPAARAHRGGRPARGAPPLFFFFCVSLSLSRPPVPLFITAAPFFRKSRTSSPPNSSPRLAFPCISRNCLPAVDSHSAVLE